MLPHNTVAIITSPPIKKPRIMNVAAIQLFLTCGKAEAFNINAGGTQHFTYQSQIFQVGLLFYAKIFHGQTTPDSHVLYPDYHDFLKIGCSGDLHYVRMSLLVS